jgi:hypothetical protein
METNNFFSIRRLYLLSQRQVFSNGTSLMIAFGGIAGFLLVLSLLVAYFNPSALPGLTSTYFVVMFIGGFIYTSNIFNEMHQIQRSYSFLTLPVSNTERLLSAWILSGILFPLVSLLAMSVIVLIANLLMNLAFDLSPFQSIFSASNMTAVKVYMVSQSVFLLGAIYFRRNNFIKTILALFIVFMVISMYTGLLGWVLFKPFSGNNIIIEGDNIPYSLEHFLTKQVPSIASFVLWYLTIPFFLLTSWFSLKEREV